MIRAIIENKGIVAASALYESALSIKRLCLFILGYYFQIYLVPADAGGQFRQIIQHGGADA